MAYQVIARKWRPGNFDEVVFQEHVSKTLRSSLRSGKISHAYLFSGPRGVGKTTVARILAKALNCKNGPTDNPCGICENCIETAKGTAFDVIEIDGASNNSVDDIRQLRENVNFAPVKGKYKVYIIDEVHMVTQAAFNALLKTLEEPPPHIVFIFATTEYHRIPETILSRCQKFFFRKIPLEIIVEHLKRIAHDEGYRISEGAIYPIARAADGAMRDAQSLFEQVLSFSDSPAQDGAEGGEIKEADVLEILGIIPLESYISQFRAISQGDAAAVFAEIERVSGMGADIPRYAAGFIDCLRAIRLLKNGVALKNVIGLSDEENLMFAETGALFSDEEISRMFRIAVELESDMRWSRNERINLEMALLDMIRIKQSPSLSSILRRIDELGAGLHTSGAKTESLPDFSKPPDTNKTESSPLAGEASNLQKELSQERAADFSAEKIKDFFFGEIIEKDKADNRQK